MSQHIPGEIQTHRLLALRFWLVGTIRRAHDSALALPLGTASVSQ